MINNSHFQPIQATVQGKPNSRLLVRIEQDGSTLSLIRLHVADHRVREEIICMHFLREYLPLKYERDCGVNILSRDCPWDFEVEIESGEYFNIEITSISDNKNLFELESAERELTFAKSNNHIHPRKILKLNKLFPHTLLPVNDNDVSLSLKNPYFEKNVITISTLPPPIATYGSLISEVVSAKANKNHKGKANTILIIDDQTTAFTRDVIISSLKSIELDDSFKEIWIYIGYWGSATGDGEYTLISCLLDS